MAFKKYEPRPGGGRPNLQAESRFPLCWLGRSAVGRPSTLSFNAAAIELLGERTEYLEVMWDADERMFAFIPAPSSAPDSLRLSRNANDAEGIKRVSTVGMVAHFPELQTLGGRTWRILVEPGAEYFVARFASQKELHAD